MYDVLAMNAHVTQLHKMTKQSIKNTNPAQHQKYIGKPFPPKFWQQSSQSQQTLVRMTYKVQILHLWYTKVKAYLPKIVDHLPKVKNGIV